MSRIILFIITLSLLGCTTAPPVATSQKAAEFLPTACLNLFYDLNYQNPAQREKAVFAYVKDKDGYACAIANPQIVGDGVLYYSIPTWEKLETVAIARCEAAKGYNKIKTPCRVFAYGNEIVWEKNDRQNHDSESESKNAADIVKSPNQPIENTAGEDKSNSSNQLPPPQVKDLSIAKKQCEELGFKPKTEKFGKCVLELSK